MRRRFKVEGCFGLGRKARMYQKIYNNSDLVHPFESFHFLLDPQAIIMTNRMKNLIGGAKQAANVEAAATALPSATPPVEASNGSSNTMLSSETPNPMASQRREGSKKTRNIPQVTKHLLCETRVVSMEMPLRTWSPCGHTALFLHVEYQNFMRTSRWLSNQKAPQHRKTPLFTSFRVVIHERINISTKHKKKFLILTVKFTVYTLPCFMNYKNNNHQKETQSQSAHEVEIRKVYSA